MDADLGKGLRPPAVAPPSFKVPLATVVGPLYVLLLVSVIVPAPALMNPPPPLIAPLKTVLVLLPPAVKTPLFKFTLPLPARLPTAPPKRSSPGSRWR